MRFPAGMSALSCARISLVVLVLCASVACGREQALMEAESPGGGLASLPSLGELEDLSGGRKISLELQTFEVLDVDPVLQNAAVLSHNPNALTLTPPAEYIAWAIFQFCGIPGDGSVAPQSLRVSGGSCYLAVPDYSEGRWKYAPASSEVFIPDFSAQPVSPNGNLFVAVFAEGSAVSLSSLQMDFNNDNLIAPPTGLTATDAAYNNRVELSWTKSAQAYYYDVYRDGVVIASLGNVDAYTDYDAFDTLPHNYRVKGWAGWGYGYSNADEGSQKRGEDIPGWKQYRANERHSARTTAIGPQNPAIKWIADFEFPVWSEPGLSPAADRAYVCAGSSPKLYCLEAETLAEQWDFALQAKAVARPITDAAGRVYFGDLGGRFYCVKADGSEAWHYDCGAAVSAVAGLDGSGNVYIGTEAGAVISVDSSGAYRWTASTANPVRFPDELAVAPDGKSYVKDADQPGLGASGHLYAFGADGSPLWVYDDRTILRFAADLPAGLLYIGVPGVTGNVFRLSLAGDELWQASLSPEDGFTIPQMLVSPNGDLHVRGGGPSGPSWSAFTPDGAAAGGADVGNSNFGSSPFVYAGDLFTFGGKDLYRFDNGGELSGRVAARIVFGRPQVSAGGRILALDGNFGGYEAVGYQACRLFSYDPDTGLMAWFGQVADTETEAVFDDAGNSYIPLGTQLYSLSAAGGLRWQAEYGRLLCHSAAVNGAVVAVSSSDESLNYNLGYTDGDCFSSARALDGTAAWEVDSPDRYGFEGSPLVLGNSFVLLNRTALYYYSSNGTLTDTQPVVDATFEAPCVTASGLRVARGYSHFAAYDPAGVEVWADPNDLSVKHGQAAADSNAVWTLEDGSVCAYSPDFGTKRGCRSGPQFSGSLPALLSDDAAVFCEFKRYAPIVEQISCFEPDGTRRWFRDFGVNPSVGWPIVDGAGTIYACAGGTLYSFSPSDGKVNWSLDIGAAASPVIAPNGQLLVKGKGAQVICVGD